VRPTVSEQLNGIRRVLGQAVAPHISDPYALNILDGLLAALGSLAAGWAQVPQFLRWDADGTVAVLTAARAILDEGMTVELSVLVDDAPDNDGDVLALETHHRRLRKLLEQAVPAIVEDPGSRALLVAHLRARIKRFPLPTPPPIRTPLTGGSSVDAAR
jgi:hypothetical protein